MLDWNSLICLPLEYALKRDELLGFEGFGGEARLVYLNDFRSLQARSWLILEVSWYTSCINFLGILLNL